MKMSKRAVVAGVATVAALGLAVVGAAAQTSAPAPAADTTINLGTELSPWLSYLVAGGVSLLTAFGGWAVSKFNAWANVQNNAAVIQLEATARDTLQSALTNAAGNVIVSLGDKLNTITLDPKSAWIKQAVDLVNVTAQDAVKRFAITPDMLGQMILNKIGVLTAANPASNPTSTPKA